MTPLQFLEATAKALVNGAQCTIGVTKALTAAGFPPTPAQETALAVACLAAASGIDFRTTIINELVAIQNWLNSQSWSPSIVDAAPPPVPSQISTAQIASIVDAAIAGGNMAACANTHRTSQKVQGAGLCCAQVGVAGGLVAPPPGTTLPAYIAGQADSGQIPTGRIVQVSYTKAGVPNAGCGSCMIVGSKSKKHPGKPVLMFVPGGPNCPTSGTGCCAL